MGALKVVGGILALAGAALALLVALDLLIGLGIFNYMTFGGSFHMATALLSNNINIYIGLALALLAIVGAILGMAGKRFGGIFALIAGALWLLGGLMWLQMPMLAPMSAMLIWTGQINFMAFPMIYVISIEAILCLIGGILVLAGGSSD